MTLKKILDDFKAVCNTMDGIRKDTVQHIEDICQMKLEVKKKKRRKISTHSWQKNDQGQHTGSPSDDC